MVYSFTEWKPELSRRYGSCLFVAFHSRLNSFERKTDLCHAKIVKSKQEKRPLTCMLFRWLKTSNRLITTVKRSYLNLYRSFSKPNTSELLNSTRGHGKTNLSKTSTKPNRGQNSPDPTLKMPFWPFQSNQCPDVKFNLLPSHQQTSLQQLSKSRHAVVVHFFTS